MLKKNDKKVSIHIIHIGDPNGYTKFTVMNGTAKLVNIEYSKVSECYILKDFIPAIMEVEFEAITQFLNEIIIENDYSSAYWETRIPMLEITFKNNDGEEFVACVEMEDIDELKELMSKFVNDGALEMISFEKFLIPRWESLNYVQLSYNDFWEGVDNG